MSLAKAESRRFMKRRMTLWMLVIGTLILGAVLTGVALTHTKPTPEVIAAAEAEAQRAYEHNVRMSEMYRADCERNVPADMKDKCGPPPREVFQADSFMPPQFKFKEYFGGTVIVWASIIALIAFVIGATFVGAEWSSGSMMNLLTWRPNRMAVLGTKLAVLLGWMTSIGVISFGLWTGALYLIGELRGNTDGMTNGTWQSFGLYGLRGVAMILAFGALGFGLASLGRHTALALGVAIAVVIVGQIGLAIVLQMASVPFMERYLIPTYMDAWLGKEVKLQDWSQPVQCGPTGCDEPPTMLITYADSGYLGLAVLIVISGLAFLSMRRRDVA